MEEAAVVADGLRQVYGWDTNHKDNNNNDTDCGGDDYHEAGCDPFQPPQPQEYGRQHDYTYDNNNNNNNGLFPLLFNLTPTTTTSTTVSTTITPFLSFSSDSLLGNSSSNASTDVLPPSLGFDDNAKTDIIIYCVMFVVAAAGNLTVFITLCRNRHRKSRVNLMIMHLAAADLMVTLINFPLEVGWRLTTQWLAGNLACKLFQFLRAFGLYLSSLVLVCISLDRYFAIVHPLKVNDAQRRGKMMLSFAWSVAAVCSLPQSVIFHVDSHPLFANFHQCVTFGFFKTQAEEVTYNLFCLAAMYFLPLVVIIIVYFRILWEISQKSRDSKEASRGGGGRGGRLRLRRSDMSNIERARSRTLRMTVIIVLAFIWCWTPYVVIVMWYMFDRASAEQVDRRLQDALFIMAVSNSCVNPLVYGTYTINLRAELTRCFRRRGGHHTQLDRRSTAYRTTLSAHMAGGTTVKPTLRAQMAGRDSTGTGGDKRSSPSLPRHPLLSSPPTSNKSPLTPLDPSSTALVSTPSPSALTSTITGPRVQAPPPQPARNGSRCIMVEIEMDTLAKNAFFPTSASNPDIATAPHVNRVHGGQQQERHQRQPIRTTSQLFSNYSGPEHQDEVQLTSFTQHTLYPPLPPQHNTRNHHTDIPARTRKMSADSGVFLEGRNRRRQQQQPSQAESDWRPVSAVTAASTMT